MQGMGFIVIYIVFFAALIYFTSIRPQKKERQKQQEMLSSVAVGDTILTTSGFYGVIIDITDDDVSVESLETIRTAVFRCRKLQSRRLKNQTQNKKKEKLFYGRRL